MQDKIILGILQYRDLTAYDLKKSMESSTSLFYNSSMGSIHPALKKLERQSNVTATNIVENGRAKKIYAITDQGREVVADWLDEGLPLEKYKDETLARLFFFGNLNPEEQARHINAHIVMLDEQIGMLEVLRAQLYEVDVPENIKPTATFQIATLDFGLSYYRFSRDWYQKFLSAQNG